MPKLLPLEPAVIASQVIAEVREFTGAPLAQEKPFGQTTGQVIFTIVVTSPRRPREFFVLGMGWAEAWVHAAARSRRFRFLDGMNGIYGIERQG
jgi:hypothetical protein